MGVHARDPEKSLWLPKPFGTFLLGEKIKFKVTYAGITVGEAEPWVKEIVRINGRDAYHIEINIRSKFVLTDLQSSRHTPLYVDVENCIRYATKRSFTKDVTGRTRSWNMIRQKREDFFPKRQQPQRNVDSKECPGSDLVRILLSDTGC